jgi:DNA polymerase-1
VEKTKYLVESSHGTRFHEYPDAKAAQTAEGEQIWSRKEVEPVENALALVKNVLEDIQDRFADWSDCVIYLSGVGNFRDSISTRVKYKGNRDTANRPVHFSAIRDYLVARWGAQYTNGQEADDAIGIAMQSSPGSVCVSFDKDMYQCAGRHYNWVDKAESTVSPKEAAKFFWQQCLSGDPTDNIPGCKGIGSVKAKRILEECKSNAECWKKVLDVYNEVHGDEGAAFALETAQLVYIRKQPNEIWSPPNV